MTAGATIVFFRLDGFEVPLLKVMDGPDREGRDQVVMIIRSEPNEHLSLHREPDGAVLLTHWSTDKPPGTWDATRVEVARKVGYRDPERHAYYYQHRPLRPVEGMNGHELGGRRVNLGAVVAKAKYAKLPRIEIDAPALEFMLAFHLSTPEQPFVPHDNEPHVVSSFGELYFRTEA